MAGFALGKTVRAQPLGVPGKCDQKADLLEGPLWVRCAELLSRCFPCTLGVFVSLLERQGASCLTLCFSLKDFWYGARS